ncbi:uncharacterized protein LOC109603798 [Aethina tumida]|uniref:uncharacterized protein LOC109603798 n=1 Tax=Aethina tumida TaxID=116153 RepID=UPI0021496D93|nr:uncharacterized protein LOC109603798 [Aethina tumida]
MDEFLKIRWKQEHFSEFEKQPEFIKDDALAQSFINKSFDTSPSVLFKCTIDKSIYKLLKSEEKLFIPCENIYFTTHTKSSLGSQKHFICLKALQLIESNKAADKYSDEEKNYIKTYQDLLPQIQNEHEKYQNFSKEMWNKDLLGLKRIGPMNMKYATRHWQNQCKRYLDYPSHYKDASIISWLYTEEDGQFDFVCMGNVLEVGTVSKFSQPSFRKTCTFNSLSLPGISDMQIKFNSQLPVSKDMNINSILEQHNIEVVLSSSALKCLLDNTNLKVKWHIPVVIKNVSLKRADGTVTYRKVVFVDKPLPKQNPNNLDMTNLCVKHLLKTNLCPYVAFSYNATDIPIEDKKSDGRNMENTSTVSQHKKIHHNAQYRIWNIKNNGSHCSLLKNKSKPFNMNILIRSKLAACDMAENGNLFPVILMPKTEQQLMLGANILSKSELSRAYTSLYFTPYSQLYRARVFPRPVQLVAIDKCNIAKICYEAAQHYQYKPNPYVLQKIVAHLVKQDVGEYLLHHMPKHEAFISIMKKCDPSVPDSYSLPEALANCKHDSESSNIPWLPIDVNYILPVFKAKNRMPGLFTPMSGKEYRTKKKREQKQRKKAGQVKDTTK